MAIDTVTGGPFSLAQGFYVPHIVYNLLYVGNPMFSWMYMLFLTVGFGVPLSSMFAIIFLLFVVGCLYAYLELEFCGVRPKGVCGPWNCANSNSPLGAMACCKK